MVEDGLWTMCGWNAFGERLNKKRFISEITLMGLMRIEASRSILAFTTRNVCTHRLATLHLEQSTGSETLSGTAAPLRHRPLVRQAIGMGRAKWVEEKKGANPKLNRGQGPSAQQVELFTAYSYVQKTFILGKIRWYF